MWIKCICNKELQFFIVGKEYNFWKISVFDLTISFNYKHHFLKPEIFHSHFITKREKNIEDIIC